MRRVLLQLEQVKCCLIFCYSVFLEAPVAPQHLRVTNISPISACISWYPSNSNAEHVILLNAIKIGVCPPSVFQVCKICRKYVKVCGWSQFVNSNCKGRGKWASSALLDTFDSPPTICGKEIVLFDYRCSYLT
jgi:hypothetical protein